MKVENSQLKQQSSDYAKLHGDLLDAEHYLKLLRDEKFRAERDAKEREDALQLKINDLQDDLKRLNALLGEKQIQLKSTDNELIKIRQLYEEKINEVAGLKAEITRLEDELRRAQISNRDLQTKVEVANSQSRTANEEINSLVLMNEKLAKLNNEEIMKGRDLTDKYHILEGKYKDLQLENDVLRRTNSVKEQQISDVESSRRVAQNEIEVLRGNCNQYEAHLDNRDRKIKDMEDQLAELNSHLTITLSKIDSRENYITTLNEKNVKAEERAIRAEGELIRLQNECKTLKDLLGKYRSDIEVQKKLREDQIFQKYELEQQKKKLEREALSKDIEARTAKRELEMVQGSKGRLLDERYQLNQELEALKEHAEILETQNSNVRINITSIS